MTKIDSFKKLGMLWNIKHADPAAKVRIPKPRKEVNRKCKNCGKPMRNIPGTNVWMCDFATMSDEKTPNGKDCQVFTRCNTREILF